MRPRRTCHFDGSKIFTKKLDPRRSRLIFYPSIWANMDQQRRRLAAGKPDPFAASNAASVGGDLFEPLATVLAALLEVPALTENLRRAVEIAEAIGRPMSEATPLPPGVRPDIGRLTAALAFAPSFTELLRYADTVDFRDLNEIELAHLERVSVKTIQRWRTQGTGPEYRCEAGISYPIRWLWEWRERGRQRMTAQKKTRGRRD